MRLEPMVFQSDGFHCQLLTSGIRRNLDSWTDTHIARRGKAQEAKTRFAMILLAADHDQHIGERWPGDPRQTLIFPLSSSAPKADDLVHRTESLWARVKITRK